MKEDEKMAEIKKDCFAFRVNGVGTMKCNALNDLYCKDGKCGFYKTREQFQKENGERYEKYVK